QRERIAQGGGSFGGPRILVRLGQDSPILSSASLKCSAVSRAVPSSRSCSCGCCRISSDTLLSIRAIPPHTQSANGLRQRGHSALGSAGDACGGAADCSVIAAVYARTRAATMRRAGLATRADRHYALHPGALVLFSFRPFLCDMPGGLGLGYDGIGV